MNALIMNKTYLWIGCLCFHRCNCIRMSSETMNLSFCTHVPHLNTVENWNRVDGEKWILFIHELLNHDQLRRECPMLDEVKENKRHSNAHDNDESPMKRKDETRLCFVRYIDKLCCILNPNISLVYLHQLRINKVVENWSLHLVQLKYDPLKIILTFHLPDPKSKWFIFIDFSRFDSLIKWIFYFNDSITSTSSEPFVTWLYIDTTNPT